MPEHPVEFPRGSCGSCGYLGCRPAPLNPSANHHPAVEVSLSARRTGQLFRVATDEHDTREGTPVCFVGRASLLDEINAAIATDPDKASNLRTKYAGPTLTHDRRCPAWIKHHHGVSPKEHWDNAMWERLEEQTKEWQASMERDRRQHEERLEGDRKLHAAALERDRRQYEDHHRRSERLLTVLVVVLTVATLVSSLLPMFWPNGWR